MSERGSTKKEKYKVMIPFDEWSNERRSDLGSERGRFSEEGRNEKRKRGEGGEWKPMEQ